jgi:Rubisco Assembly chaperone C-terminal domain
MLSCKCIAYVALLFSLVTMSKYCIAFHATCYPLNMALRNRIITRSELAMKSGGHGENFHFMPINQATRKTHFPRILKIAGVFSEMTPEDLMAPPTDAAPPVGTWAYDFSDPEGPQLGTVAIPGSPVLTDSLDPVVMIATSTDLNLKFPEETELLVVVDRADIHHRSDDFYVFRTPENTLRIMWTDRVEPGYEVMGKVVVVTAPFVEAMAPKATGFAESDEDDESD